MSPAHLPDNASLEYLKKLAKERLRELRVKDPSTKLTTAQLGLAREYGFASWRALKAEIDRRGSPSLAAFFTACQSGDVTALRDLLDREPELVRARNQEGSTGLHAATAHPECITLLLELGADPNARDVGDNAYALHFAAAMGYLDTVRALLDAGGDVHGVGDLHRGEVIGWASGTAGNGEVIALLLQRGARHHIFSAIAIGDKELVRALVHENPASLSRRRSRFEQGQTPLHFTLSAPDGLQSQTPRYDMAALLIELGADVEATDDKGRTPLAVAMLHGDLEAMRLLKSAGAKEPRTSNVAHSEDRLRSLRSSMRQQVTPMLCVDDVDAAVAWYASLGFTLRARHPETGHIGWAAMSFGKVELMLQERMSRPGNQIALWFHTDQIEELYQLFKNRQLAASQAALAGKPSGAAGIHFMEDLYDPFYGGRQFSISDVNGFELVFQSE